MNKTTDNDIIEVALDEADQCLTYTDLNEPKHSGKCTDLTCINKKPRNECKRCATIYMFTK